MPPASHRAHDLTVAALGGAVLAATGAMAATGTGAGNGAGNGNGNGTTDTTDTAGTVSAVEREVFEAVNGLPDVPYAVVWPFLQLGSLGGALAVAAAAGVARGRRAGLTVAASGVATWALVKAAKAAVGRGRPATVLADVVARGEEATGEGFPSAHAAVAAAVAAAAWPWLPRGARIALAVLAGVVAVLRVYVGAHLPLDVVGGAALGVLVAGLVRLAARWTG